MPGGVGDGLHRDPVRGRLDRGRQRGQPGGRAGDLDPHVARQGRRPGPDRATTPSSSSAGGRSASTSRRTSASDAAASAAISSSSGRAGEPPGTALAASPAFSPIAARLRPSPSCRSRRSRRRSSSREATTSARERARSSCSRTACTAVPACCASEPIRTRSTGSSGSSGSRADTRSHPISAPWWRSGSACTGPAGSPCRAASWLPPAPSTRSIATYGTRSERATVSTTAGSTSAGSGAACSRAPSRVRAPAGSCRSPYMTRLTVLCARLRSGARASAAPAAVSAAATGCDSRRPPTRNATTAAYPATRTATTAAYTRDRLASRSMSNSRCRRSATPTLATNGSPDSPSAPHGSGRAPASSSGRCQPASPSTLVTTPPPSTQRSRPRTSGSASRR
ncbi:hypothetical protein MF672_021190 [Actinomadura sp. ATCC 31491]|uniref:Uncharacterized protein n=1 Tax=Actinomadura luzonensis TaxID=2805427 RepID=A0ABT0FVE0_9ACTN|nr:hypothetical protein [Actinomadura luzonensis]MCK2216297.1 hypothetical protein [Actinomadura luzonensis]